jgi:gliding motility-associated-like protein
MRTQTILAFLFLLPFLSPGQKRAAHWVFGGNGGLDFSCAPPRLYLTAFDGLEGAASISDEDGNLLMYSNGDDIFDRSHRVMQNGDGLIGLCNGFATYASASQSTLFVPHPGNPNLYYLFTTDCAEDNYADGFQYTLIDMTLNNGLGGVISKNNPLFAPAAEKIAAVFHANGSDVWVVGHELGNNRFRAYLISEDGLNTSPVISATGQVHEGGRGYLKFSPDGKKLAAGSFVFGLDDGAELELFSFNDNTGSINSLFTLPDEIKSIYGLSFSPDGSKLYSSCSWTCAGGVVQHDLNAGSVEAIKNSRFVFDNPTAAIVLGAFQLGPDGKLYFLTGEGMGFIGVISNPNNPGSLANFNPQFIALDYCTVRPSWGLPNFIESYFQTSFTGSTSCDPAELEMIKKVDFDIVPTEECNKITIIGKSELALELRYGMARPTWFLDYGDGQIDTGPNTIKQIVHEYANPGTYTVQLFIQDLCEIKSHTEVVVIEGIDNAFSTEQSCDNLSVLFTNESSNFPSDVRWRWSFGDGSAPNESTSPVHAFTRTGVFTVTLSAESDIRCDASLEKQVHVYPPLHLDLAEDTTICEGDVYAIEGDDNAGASYEWSNGVADRTAAITSPGTYTLIVSRDNCAITDEITVDLDDDCLRCDLFIPNTFTPGEMDSFNPTFTLESDCIFEAFALNVFDRYGHRLFTTEDRSGWDGNIKGREASAGTYYFTFDITRTMLNGKPLRETKKGWVSLIR